MEFASPTISPFFEQSERYFLNKKYNSWMNILHYIFKELLKDDPDREMR
jgi:hypothetical protein